MVDIKTKFNAVIAIVLVALIILVPLAVSLTRTISDTGDTADTYIRNSKGNYWTATGANIQTAIWDLNASGGTVWIPSGTISLSSHLILNNHIDLVGAGVYSTILNLTSNDAYGNIYASGKHNVSVRDMTINGNRNNVIGSNAIDFRAMTDFTLQNLYCHSFDGNGIRIASESGDAWCKRGFVDNIYVDDVPGSSLEAFAFNNISQTMFSNLHCRNSAATYSVDFHGIRNCTIDGVITEESGGIKIYGEGNWYCYNNTFNNLIVRKNTQTLDCGLWVYETRNTNINNVQLDKGYNGIRIELSSYINLNNVKTNYNSNCGLYMVSSNHININNAFFYHSISNPIYISACNNMTMSNIEVIDAKNYGYIETSKDFSIDNSIFSKSTSYGIDMVTCARFSVSNTRFYFNTEDGITTELGTCNNYTISNCYFSGNDKALDIHASDNYFIVSGCICTPGDGIDINAIWSSTRRVNDTICVLTIS